MISASMKRYSLAALSAAVGVTVVLQAGPLHAAAEANKTEPVDVARLLDSARESAVKVPALYLSRQEKIATVEAFVSIVRTKSESGSEAGVRDLLRRRLARLNAREIICDRRETNAPLKLEMEPPQTNAPFNLIMEIPATKGLEDRPPVILNAHMDTIRLVTRCVPEEMDFNPDTREFYHRRDLSFGADDKAGVTTVLRALEVAKSGYWDKGAGHRRFVVIFTAQEERGCVGARYLNAYYPQLFENAEILLATDGPLDYDTPAYYPKNSFIVVVNEETSHAPPYRQIVQCVQEVCSLKQAYFAKTTTGLGQGDFAFFPPAAHTDLHIRSPYKGNHRHERVKLDDLFNHIDLFTYIILRLDGTAPQSPAVGKP
jgi:acetylornithine deacetylase/succinyl-diaminopimelate desuccinylase-like protein